MFQFLVVSLMLVSSVTFAEQRTQPLEPSPQANTTIPGPAGTVQSKVNYEVLPGTEDLGTIFTLLESELKMQRGVGHSVTAALLAICAGKPEDKVAALKEMDRALMKYGPDLYRNSATNVYNNNNGGFYNNGRYYNNGGYTPVAKTIASDALMGRIAAVLTCKQDNRTADEMAKMLTSAYQDAIKKVVQHPTTGENLSWQKDLTTVLMIATLLK